MQTAAPPVPKRPDEIDQVLRWRFDQLRAAGYGEDDAHELAARSDVDLHVAVRLLLRRCPPATALRILR